MFSIRRVRRDLGAWREALCSRSLSRRAGCPWARVWGSSLDSNLVHEFGRLVFRALFVRPFSWSFPISNLTGHGEDWAVIASGHRLLFVTWKRHFVCDAVLPKCADDVADRQSSSLWLACSYLAWSCAIQNEEHLLCSLNFGHLLGRPAPDCHHIQKGHLDLEGLGVRRPGLEQVLVDGWNATGGELLLQFVMGLLLIFSMWI